MKNKFKITCEKFKENYGERRLNPFETSVSKASSKFGEFWDIKNLRFLLCQVQFGNGILSKIGFPGLIEVLVIEFHWYLTHKTSI